MEKEIMIKELVEDLLSLSDEKYQEAKDYWKEHPPGSVKVAEFVDMLLMCTDIKRRKVGASNVSL